MVALEQSESPCHGHYLFLLQRWLELISLSDLFDPINHKKEEGGNFAQIAIEILADHSPSP